MINVAVLFSGRGSNLGSIISRSLQSDSSYNVIAAITDNPLAAGIEIAYNNNITTYIIPKVQFEKKALSILDNLGIDLVVLAGFMSILDKSFCSRWEGRCINIHPSLLPKYKGLNTHKRVIENKETETGCTVHYVTPRLDDGPIIAQSKVAINDNDDRDDISQRVLKEENKLLPQVVQMIGLEKIALLNKNKVLFGINDYYIVIPSPLLLEDLE